MKLNLYLASTLFVGAFSFAQNLSSEIPAELRNKSNVVYLLNQSDIRIKRVDKITTNYQTEVIILNQKGEFASSVSIHYDDRTKVSGIKVEVIDQNNKLVKTYGKSDFSDYNNTSSSTVFSDGRVLHFKPESLVYPYKVKYSYTVDTSDTAFIADFYPFWSYNASTVRSITTITNDSGINLRSKVLNTQIGSVQENKNGNVWTYYYSNIKPINNEVYSPSLRSLIPRVQFSLDKFSLAGKEGSITDWDDFGKWYYHNLLEPSTTITPSIKSEVAALKLTGTIEEKVNKIFQYMQDKTRYVSVQMGIGGWQPMPIQTVSDKRYGDCKALSNYMRGLLSAAGIKSFYSVIYSDDSPVSFDEDFPRLGGNHAILMVPTDNGNIWLENTSQIIGFNHLSYSTTNRNVLAISEDGIKLINTPNYPAEKSVEKMTGKMILSKDGTSVLKSTFNYTGYQYDIVLGYLETGNEKQKNAFKSFYNTLDIDDLTFENLVNDRSLAKISYDIDFKVKNYTSELDTDLIIKAIPLSISSLNKDDKRVLPLELRAEFSEEYSIEYEAPKGYSFKDIPSSSNLKSQFGEYDIIFEKVGDNLKVTRRLKFIRGNFKASEFNNYANFRKKIYNLDNTKLLITQL